MEIIFKTYLLTLFYRMNFFNGLTIWTNPSWLVENLYSLSERRYWWVLSGPKGYDLASSLSLDSFLVQGMLCECRTHSWEMCAGKSCPITSSSLLAKTLFKRTNYIAMTYSNFILETSSATYVRAKNKILHFQV